MFCFTWHLAILIKTPTKGAFSLPRASDQPQTGWSRRTSDHQKWREKALSDGLWETRASVSQEKNEFDPPRTSDSSANQIVFHVLPSHVHLFPVSYLGSLEREIYLISQQFSLNWQHKLHWKERHPVVKELNTGLTFFRDYEQEMVAISGNTGSAPVIGSSGWASDRSICSEKGSSSPGSDAKQDSR